MKNHVWSLYWSLCHICKLKCENKHQMSERCHPCSAQWDKLIELMFYSPVVPSNDTWRPHSCRIMQKSALPRTPLPSNPTCTCSTVVHVFVLFVWLETETAFWNQQKGENDHSKHFRINLCERMSPDPARIEPATSWSSVSCASDWAIEAGSVR